VLYSKLFGKTLKEVPRGAKVISHQLLLRGGFIYQTSAGLFSFLPLGFRVLQNIDRIIREELSKSGVQHLLMPFVHPVSLWEETGRFEKMQKIMAVFSSARGHDHLLAPTHEETVTDLARNYIMSYKDLPVIVNQNQWKYRDEIRVSGGLLRTCEFLMQDAYSFDSCEEDLGRSFITMKEAYDRIFRRLELDTIVVTADSGTMGGSDSNEYMLKSEVGEDDIVTCDNCDYRANTEAAKAYIETEESNEEMKPLKKVFGEGIIGVDDLMKFLDIDVKTATKTIIFKSDDEFVAVMIVGNYEINEVKLKNVLNSTELRLANAKEINELTGAEVGYAGPMNLSKNIRLIADLSCKGRRNFEGGANETNYHYLNINFGRDVSEPEYFDIRVVENGDVCEKCKNGKLKIEKAIELGHIFKLGSCYAEKMNAKFKDKDGQEKTLLMGCYGIGITRVMAAAVEQYNDDNGIIWPKEIAPFKVHLLHLGDNDDVINATQKLYDDLLDAGVEVLYDDRNERPGRKLNDADLIGNNIRILVSNKTLAEKSAEIKIRGTNDVFKIALDKVVDYVNDN